MGSIKKEVEIVGLLKNKKIVALFDSGATFNYIRRKLTDGEDVMKNIGCVAYEGPHNVILGDGTSILDGKQIRFNRIRIKKHKQDFPLFVIVDKLSEDVIIGVVSMQKMGIILDLPNEKIRLKTT